VWLLLHCLRCVLLLLLRIYWQAVSPRHITTAFTSPERFKAGWTCALPPTVRKPDDLRCAAAVSCSCCVLLLLCARQPSCRLSVRTMLSQLLQAQVASRQAGPCWLV
jgi:hypothetical protein